MTVNIDELERLEREATKWPWEHKTFSALGAAEIARWSADCAMKGGPDMHLVQSSLAPVVEGEESPTCAIAGNGPTSEANAALIATLRNAAPALITELRAARRVVEAARTQEHETWCDSLPRGTWVPVGCNCWQSNVWHELKAYDTATSGGGKGR